MLVSFCLPLPRNTMLKLYMWCSLNPLSSHNAKVKFNYPLFIVRCRVLVGESLTSCGIVVLLQSRDTVTLPLLNAFARRRGPLGLWVSFDVGLRKKDSCVSSILPEPAPSLNITSPSRTRFIGACPTAFAVCVLITTRMIFKSGNGAFGVMILHCAVGARFPFQYLSGTLGCERRLAMHINA